jgi:hypothetical protein
MATTHDSSGTTLLPAGRRLLRQVAVGPLGPRGRAPGANDSNVADLGGAGVGVGVVAGPVPC